MKESQQFRANEGTRSRRIDRVNPSRAKAIGKDSQIRHLQGNGKSREWVRAEKRE